MSFQDHSEASFEEQPGTVLVHVRCQQTPEG